MKSNHLVFLRYYSLTISIIVLLLGLAETYVGLGFYDPLWMRVVLCILGITFTVGIKKIKIIRDNPGIYFYMLDSLVAIWLLYLLNVNDHAIRYSNSLYLLIIVNAFLFFKSKHLIFFNICFMASWFLSVYYTSGSINHVDNRIILALITASSTIGYFFINSRNNLRRALEDYKKENEIRKAREQELKQKSNELSAILNANPDLIFIQDIDSTYINYFTSNEDMLLLKPEDFLGKKMKDVLPEMLYNVINKAFQRAKVSGRNEEVSYYTPDGKGGLNYWEARINRFTDDQIITITRDVTTIERQKQNILNQNKFIEEVTNANQNKVIVYDIKQNVITFSNDSEVFGFQYDTLLDDNFKLKTIVHPEDYNEVLKDMIAVVQGTSLNDLEKEIRIIGNNYEIYWADLSVKVFSLDDKNNVKEILIVINDITERKKRASELAKIEARWQFALESSGDGIWDWNLETNEVYFSKQWKAMIGFEDHEIPNKLEEWDKRIHPDDKDQTYADINSHIEGKTDIYVNEHRVLCKDGSYKWILDRGKIIERDQGGKPLRMIGTHSDLDDRIANEKELAETNLKFTNLFDFSPVGLFETDSEGGCTRVNKVWSEIAGLNQDEALGNGWVKAIHPDDKEYVFTEWEKFQKEEKEYNLEYRFLNQKTGDIYHIQGVSKPIFGTDGEISGYLGAIVDRTEQVIKDKDFSLIFKNIKIGIWKYDPVNNILDWDDSMYDLYDMNKDNFSGAVDAWISSLHPEYVESSQEELRLSLEENKPFDTVFAILTPEKRKKYIEAKAIIDRDSNGKAIFMTGINIDVTDKYEDQEKLKNLERIWYFALEGVGDGVWDWNVPSGTVTYSDKWKALIGYESDEIKDDFSEWARLVHPDDQEASNEILNNYLDGKSEVYESEFRMRTKTGEWKWILSRGKTLSFDNNGNPLRIIGTHTDIDERKKFEEQIIRQSEELTNSNIKFEKLLNSISGAFWIKDLTNERIIYLSEKFESIWGHKVEEIMNGSVEFWEPVHEDELEKLKHYNDNLIKTRKYDFEIKLHVDNKIKWLNIKAEVVKVEGVDLKFGYAEDITERKDYEVQLIEKTEQLYLAQQMAKIGGWKVDLITNTLTWSDEVKRIHEVPLDYKPNLETAIEFYIPEHREKITKAIDQAIKKGKAWDIELQIQTAKGKIKWVRAIGRAIYDEYKNPIELTGTFQDIDQQKQTQEEKNKLFDLSLDMIAIAGFDGFFKQLNNTWTQVLGWSETELLAKPYLDFVHVDDRENTVKTALDLEEEKTVVSFENRYLTKDGNYRWLSWNALPDIQNNVIFAITRDITEQKQQEIKLKEVANQMKMAQDMAKIGSWSMDLTTNMPYWSEMVRMIHEMPEGYQPDLETAINFYIPEHRPLVTEYVQNAITQGTGWDFELKIQTGKGNIKWVRSIGKAIYDEDNNPVKLTGTFQDINQQKRTSEEKNKIFDISVDMICVINFDGFFTQINQAWKDNLGWSEEEMLTKPIFTFVHPEEVEFIAKQFKELAVGKNLTSFEIRFVDLFGNYKWLSWNAIATKNDEQIYAIARDVTDEKRKSDELEKAKIDAEQANRTKSNFLANMSHEIRTPMNAIIGFSSLLQDTLDDSESKSYVDSIINSGKSLLTLINDILDLSKIEAGRLDINYEDFNIEALLHEVVRIFKVKSDEKSIVLDLKLSDKFPKLFRIDGVRLRQILFNIVGNAIKFTEDGSVTIVANFNEDNESLMIEVTDTGICIPENQQEKVFQAFRQQEEQSTRKYGGTGLGLTITKQLTEMMNGNIFVSSINGKGSTFSVKFNNIEVIDSKKSEITRNKPTSGHFEISKVLIVEDNDLNFKLLKRMISKVSNAEVRWAENGKIGIERFIEFRPDIVLMDVHMPVMDGLESTINIRDLEFGQDVPIIAVTAAAMKEDIEANSLLFEDYLIKPITKNDIIELFSNYFEKIEDDVELVEISSNSDNNEINEDTLNLISRELSKEIEENAKAFDMDLANSLVESINKLSEEKQNSQIKNFASKLAKCIENFDIEGFEEQLKLVS